MSPSPARCALFVLSLSLTALAGVAGCDVGGWEDPTQVHDRIVQAVRTRDGGTIYDLLDSARRAQVDTFIGAQLASLEKLPPEERPVWEALKGASKREIYAKVLASDPAVDDIFGEGAKVVRIDTIVYVTVEHGGRRDLLYLRPQGRKLQITNSPDAIVYGPRKLPQPRSAAPPVGAGDSSMPARK